MRHCVEKSCPALSSEPGLILLTAQVVRGSVGLVLRMLIPGSGSSTTFGRPDVPKNRSSFRLVVPPGSPGPIRERNLESRPWRRSPGRRVSSQRLEKEEYFGLETEPTSTRWSQLKFQLSIISS